jgi:hypothetical protein
MNTYIQCPDCIRLMPVDDARLEKGDAITCECGIVWKVVGERTPGGWWPLFPEEKYWDRVFRKEVPPLPKRAINLDVSP